MEENVGGRGGGDGRREGGKIRFTEENQTTLCASVGIENTTSESHHGHDFSHHDQPALFVALLSDTTERSRVQTSLAMTHKAI